MLLQMINKSCGFIKRGKKKKKKKSDYCTALGTWAVSFMSRIQVVYWNLCRPVAQIYLVSTNYAAANIVSGSFSISFLRFCKGSCLQGNS